MKSKRNSKIVEILKMSFDSKDIITMFNDTIIIKRIIGMNVYICNINIISNLMKIFINGNLIFEETFEETIVDLNNSGLSEDDELNIHDFGNEIFELWEKIIS